MKDEKRYRALNFDLKIKLLKEHYPKKNFLGAYRDIKSFMLRNGFSHRQGSGYRSNKKLTDRQVRKLMLQMRKELPWIDKCSTKIDITNIGKIYDIKTFYSLWDLESGVKDIDKIFKDSEIKIFDTVDDKRKSLNEQIKHAKQTANESQKNKYVLKNREQESYDR